MEVNVLICDICEKEARGEEQRGYFALEWEDVYPACQAEGKEDSYGHNTSANH